MASLRRLRRKQCERKVRHPSAEIARMAMQHTGSGIAGGLGVYQCKHCRGWHVGHVVGSRFLITEHLRIATP